MGSLKSSLEYRLTDDVDVHAISSRAIVSICEVELTTLTSISGDQVMGGLTHLASWLANFVLELRRARPQGASLLHQTDSYYGISRNEEVTY